MNNSSSKPSSDGSTTSLDFSLLTGELLWTCLGLITAVNNVQTIYVAAKSKQFLLLCFLAIGDLSLGLAHITSGIYRMPLTVLNITSPVEQRVGLLTPWVYLFVLGYFWSGIARIIIVFERLVAVIRPLWYRANWNRGTELRLVKAACICAVVLIIPIPFPTLLEPRAAQIDPKLYVNEIVAPLYVIFYELFAGISGFIATIGSVVVIWLAKKQFRKLNLPMTDSFIRRQRRMNRSVTAILAGTVLLVELPNMVLALSDLGLIQPLDPSFRINIRSLFLLNATMELFCYLLFNSEFRACHKEYIRNKLRPFLVNRWANRVSTDQSEGSARRTVGSSNITPRHGPGIAHIA